MSWNTINFSQAVILRGTVQQSATDEGLIWNPPSFTHSVQDSSGGASRFVSREGCAIRRFELHNRSGGVAFVGVGFRLHIRFWQAGQWDNSETTAYIDDTTDAQDVGANDFALETAATANDGFVIASRVPFGWVSINVGTAGVDGAGATDRAVRYSNWAGTGWTTLATNSAYTDNFTSTNTVWAAGENVFVWRPPVNWGKVVSLNGVPAGMYAINVQSTTAPDTTAALVTAIEVGTLIPVEAVADNGTYYSEQSTYRQPEADAVVAYFGTANAGNGGYVEVTSI